MGIEDVKECYSDSIIRKMIINSNIYIKGFITLVYDELKVMIPTEALTVFMITSKNCSLNYHDERFRVEMLIDSLTISINLKEKQKFIFVSNCSFIVDAEKVLKRRDLKEIHVNDSSFLIGEETDISVNDSILIIKTKELVWKEKC